MISIKKTFLKILRRYQKKPVLKAFAEKCIKCNKKFGDGDCYIGLAYEGRIDLDMHYSKTLEQHEITEYIFSHNHGFKSDAICHDCFNKFLNNKTIVYYGHDYIHAPPNFFKDK